MKPLSTYKLEELLIIYEVEVRPQWYRKVGETSTGQPTFEYRGKQKAPWWVACCSRIKETVVSDTPRQAVEELVEKLL